MPLIACFHGGGSNGEIYRQQCAQLERLLEPEFRLVFFDAPFERSPGPGVLPAFRDYGPFRSWFTQDNAGTEISDGSGYDRIGRDGVERVLDLMERQGGAEDWVGAMGFSQGTRIVGGLLRDQQRRETLGEKGRIRLAFGVFCMGGGAPMEAESGHHIDASDSFDPITLPTLHVHGLRDPFLHLGVQQTETYFNPQSRTVLEVDYHHAMPWVRSEVQQLASMIRSLYSSVVKQ
ncbi:uncharacterized protein EURHEDRAFT_518081 [Aspergillus ruber CBS 135680]|uniref:Serine hydrolase domain-containing protein n=1 Tax=Aspergillus ruber (strain CBS 135680) TaxID=1388766 RepID=A0A017S5B3_ASPRC|nr:uncharacterized protein EURHEDRAFT_518081 [Aspergillus ruber CBS 135680]EYE92016.1 hypothetical protein EURHEDRAFT_518081 [Aspergillus ruber CBS 135680]